jgi:hypothetical protein
MLGHDSLENYFKTNFAMMQHHKYSLYDIENMMPWERAVYIELLAQHVKEIEERNRDQAVLNKRRK